MRNVLGWLIVILLIVGSVPAGSVTLTSAQDSDSFTLTIMHTNDTHAQHEPNSDGNGGAARQMTLVASIRAEGGHSILLDAGDRFTGTLFHQQYHGQDNVQIMNLLGYDALGLGNHEFDNGDAILALFVQGLDFPVVNANIDFSASPDLAGLIAPYAVLDVDGEPVGVIGLLTAETPVLASPGDDLVFSDDLAGIAQTAVDELTAQGVDKIILLTHIGYTHDIALAARVDGVDVIVGGHDHVLLSNTDARARGHYPTVITSTPGGSPVLIVQAYSNNEFLGRLDVTFDAAGVPVNWEGDAILLDSSITPHPAMETLIETLAAPIEELRQIVIGETAVLLVGDRSVCRVAECNLGNLITDAVREYTGVDIVIQNGGGIRADIQAGAVTLGDVLTVLPFGNLTSTMALQGEYVLAALENGVSEVQEGAGRFPQVSGLRYSWDLSQPAGSRIVSVEVLNPATGAYEPLDPAAIYTVATNDYMRGGGDGYTMFEEYAINPYDYGKPLDEIVADYITAHSPVAPEVEGRITRVQ